MGLYYSFNIKFFFEYDCSLNARPKDNIALSVYNQWWRYDVYYRDFTSPEKANISPFPP